MPGFDGSGPRGAGPMTGAMRGACTGFGGRGAVNGFSNEGFPGRGGGGGRGWKNRFFSNGIGRQRRSPGFGFGPDAASALDVESETGLDTLKAMAGYFEKILDGIRRRIQKLDQG